MAIMTNSDNDKNEQNVTESAEGKGNVLAAFVLFEDANMDWTRFKKNLEDDWDITFDDEIKDGAVVFSVDDMTVACSLMPSPVPNKEAEEAAKRNILWKDGAEVVAKHGAHMIVAIMNKPDALDQQELLAKVSCSLLKLDNAIGIYKAPTVYEKEFYINFAKTIDEGECPCLSTFSWECIPRTTRCLLSRRDLACSASWKWRYREQLQSRMMC